MSGTLHLIIPFLELPAVIGCHSFINEKLKFSKVRKPASCPKTETGPVHKPGSAGIPCLSHLCVSLLINHKRLLIDTK